MGADAIPRFMPYAFIPYALRQRFGFRIIPSPPFMPSPGDKVEETPGGFYYLQQIGTPGQSNWGKYEWRRIANLPEGQTKGTGG